MINDFYECPHDNYKADLKFRLENYVDKKENGCLEWRRNTTRVGYGTISVKFKGDKKSHTALCHRLLWEITYNLRLSRDEYILHKCDNPKCLNLEHLRLGTAKDNSEDMVRKGRSTKGRKRPYDPSAIRAKPRLHTRKRKFSNETIRQIKAATGKTKHIAEQFGTTPGYVSKLKRGKAKTLITT